MTINFKKNGSNLLEMSTIVIYYKTYLNLQRNNYLTSLKLLGYSFCTRLPICMHGFISFSLNHVTI